MKIRGIIFDKDGTLLDFDELWVPTALSAVKRVITSVGANPQLCSSLMESIGISDNTASIEGSLCYGTYRIISEDFGKVFRRNGYVIDEEKLFEITVEAFHESFSKEIIKPTCDNIDKVFEALSERGIRCAIVTSDDKETAEKCLERLGIIKFFSRIYADNGIDPSKPNPYYINRFCEEEQLNKDEVIMVGDTLTDMEFAANGGIKAVGVAKTDKNKSILLTVTDTVLNDVSQIFEVLS